MFESIQDYMCKEIDKEKLVDNMTLCDEYQNASQDIKDKLDLYIEDIKDAQTEDEVINLLNPNFLYDLGIQPDSLKLLDLATRTNGGVIPVLDPAQLAAFIDLCMENTDDERLFRLVFNYDSLLFDKTKIEDYFINNNNVFYVCEMACHDLIGVHYEKLRDVLLNSNQLDELKYFATNVSDKNLDISSVLAKIKELDV